MGGLSVLEGAFPQTFNYPPWLECSSNGHRCARMSVCLFCVPVVETLSIRVCVLLNSNQPFELLRVCNYITLMSIAFRFFV